MNCVDAEFLKSCPIPKADAGVDERNFDEIVKRVFNGVPWHSFGNQFANEQPRDGRIAVGKVKTRRTSGGVACRGITHARSGARIEIHSLKTGKAKRPTIEGRLRVNTDAPFTV